MGFALRPSDLMRSFGGELEPVLLRLSNKPNELDNEQIELLYVGAVLGVIAIFGAALSPRSPLPTTRSPSEPPLSRRQLSTCSACGLLITRWSHGALCTLSSRLLIPLGALYRLCLISRVVRFKK